MYITSALSQMFSQLVSVLILMLICALVVLGCAVALLHYIFNIVTVAVSPGFAVGFYSLLAWICVLAVLRIALRKCDYQLNQPQLYGSTRFPVYRPGNVA